ncbi:MAG: helix-turn-helix transcriptional regulator [Elusimicrobia bacterium]|nr:helix-turn-helix transcriptional regulator [Elusimicrobiota bacterium]
MEKDIYRIVGQRVRMVRLKRGWTQEELGARSELHPSFVGQVERGTKKISLVTLAKLAHALRATKAELLDEQPVRDDAGLEEKIAHLVREQPADRQRFIYKVASDLSRLASGYRREPERRQKSRKQ